MEKESSRHQSHESADIGSDHHLLLAKVKIKLAVQKKPKRDRVKYTVKKLRNENARNQFQLVLSNKYDALYNGSDMDKEKEKEDSVDKE